MADVFISYAREDRARAEQVARALSAEGFDVFWDNEIPPGQTWADFTEAKLSASKALIVLWSGSSTQSQWVREEARMARDTGKLIPASIDGSVAPFGFGEVQSADLSNWTGRSDDPSWRRVRDAVLAKVGAPSNPRPAAPPAFAQFSAAVGAAAAGLGAASSQLGGSGAEAHSPIGYIRKCLQMYVNGKGRARRSEYWWWVLFAVGVSLVFYLADVVLFGFNSFTNQPNQQILSGLASLALLAPGLSVASRRCHDVGLSGWWVAGAFGGLFAGSLLAMGVAALGGLVVLATLVAIVVVALMPSKPGPNQYGPNPKGA